MPRYAKIVLPLAQNPYTYELCEGLDVHEGDAVVIPFGAKRDKFYTGIVWSISQEKPPFDRIKRVERKLYSKPLLNAKQRLFWEWIADYYMCTVGEVMRVALPSMMKPSGWSDQELMRDEYRPREECYVALSQKFRDSEEERNTLLDSVEKRAPRQYEALLEILSVDKDLFTSEGEIPRRLLSADISVLNSLVRKEVISLSRHSIEVEKCAKNMFQLPKLSEHQQNALEKIETSFLTKSTTLLHGITGSGKTEIYIHLIANRLAKGGDVLLLVPEIALTTQLIDRMELIFGTRVIAYHSKLTNQKRSETYLQINNSQGGNFVVGVRSSIFLPLNNLQLIIIDEEHDASYKQSDPAPRYNARDCSIYLTKSFAAHTLLGSATPSLESWTNAQSGKYGHAILSERYGEAKPPVISVSDTIRSVKRGERRGHFNFDLLGKIRERIDQKEQVMLFQNRRGFAPYIECPQCGWSARCPHCNVTLTMHKGTNQLSCHYCGYTQPREALCPNCETGEPKPMGFGTEKIEEQLGELMPESRVVRLDRDTATSERAFRAIIDDFEAGNSQIMVGTQMITKGFDFSKVTLVGILNADNMLNNPDFRAEERAFQLMMQVAGRAGRRSDNGEVVIQTSQPKHRILGYVATNDYESMARDLLEERHAFCYPPYSRIIAITMRHSNLDTLHRGANWLSQHLREIFGRRLQGPVAPPVDRIRGEHIVNMSLKIELGISSAKARLAIKDTLSKFRSETLFKSITVTCNVDPQ